jgi:hypothetical protein
MSTAWQTAGMEQQVEWRADFVDSELNALHAAGCEWLHVDFADDVADFYLRVCEFQPTQAGLRYLQ